jgi:hypothetical protein
MRDHALIKRPRRGPVYSSGAQVTEHRIETREIRSYESEYINALWHLDFHHGSLRVLINKGRWIYPLLLGIIDDHSRLCCHAQWYLAEGAEELCHGLCQALQKRALPQALMSDNGSAMLAAETTEGLARLGIVHEKTLPLCALPESANKKASERDRRTSVTFNLVLDSRFAEAQTRCEEAQRLANEIGDGVQKSDRNNFIFIQGNLAHWLLFQGHYDEALAIYRQYWDKPLNGKTFGELTLEDFAAFDKAGLTHADLSRMKQALSDLTSKSPSP